MIRLTNREGTKTQVAPFSMRRQKIVKQLKRNRAYYVHLGEWLSSFRGPRIVGAPRRWLVSSVFFGDGTVWDAHSNGYRKHWQSGERVKVNTQRPILFVPDNVESHHLETIARDWNKPGSVILLPPGTTVSHGGIMGAIQDHQRDYQIVAPDPSISMEELTSWFEGVFAPRSDGKPREIL